MDDQNKFVSFRCPPKLAIAMHRLADQDLISMSDIIRQAVIKELRQRGLMDEGRA
jgi:hypothetical protein